MAKQRMVIKLSVDDKKKRSKALKTAVEVEGVISVELGDDNQLVLVGEGTDVVDLTTLLRKRLGFADVISVTPWEQIPEAQGMPSTATSTQIDSSPNGSNYQYAPPPYLYQNPYLYRSPYSYPSIDW